MSLKIYYYDANILRCSLFFFFKQKTAYEMRISDWSSDVCSSDLALGLMARYSPRHQATQSACKSARSSRNPLNSPLFEEDLRATAKSNAGIFPRLIRRCASGKYRKIGRAHV